jgi:hypothetical protein
VDALVEEWAWDVPLRLLGGLHWLVLAGRAAWDDVPGALRGEAAFLRRFVAEQGVQTNEVQRSWVLLPLFLRVAERTGAEALELVELGPSAGLNLVWDRYRYRFVGGNWGSDSARLTLEGRERAPVPARLLGLRPELVRRVGIDQAPIDVTTEEGARLLTCFVWADQRARIERLRAAIAALREDPPELVAGDLAESLPGVLERRRAGALTVVFQTAVLGYVDDDTRQQLREALAAAGARAPLAFVSTGRPRGDARSWGLRITYWPGGEREFAGHADYHGSWLRWEL